MQRNLAFLTLLVAALSTAHAQSFTAVDLGAGGSTSSSGLVAGGYTLAGTARQATLWDSSGASASVHPAFLASPLNNGASSISGRAGDLSVGYGVGASTSNRMAAMRWDGTDASFLSLPFTAYSSKANATDGSQIVGEALPLDVVRDVATAGTSHALVWNVASGGVTDLTSSGNPTFALGVGGGQQVGYEFKGFQEARLWFGSSKGFVVMHPKAYDDSVCTATDGVHQVGSVGLQVQIFVEKRGRSVRFDYAGIWSGTAASFQVLPSIYSVTYALGVRGDTVCGYGMPTNSAGTRSGNRAVAWVNPTHDVIDLHATLPAGFTNSVATGVDESGDIVGYATDSNFVSHAIRWIRA